MQGEFELLSSLDEENSSELELAMELELRTEEELPVCSLDEEISTEPLLSAEDEEKIEELLCVVLDEEISVELEEELTGCSLDEELSAMEELKIFCRKSSSLGKSKRGLSEQDKKRISAKNDKIG